jgi:hypothetical protein
MKERRLHARFVFKGLDIHGRMISASEVKLIDLSAGGIALKADMRLDMNRVYLLQIEYGDRSLPLYGAVVWSTLTETSGKPRCVPIYTAGMQFDDIPIDKLNDLIEFIRSCKLDNKASIAYRREG